MIQFYEPRKESTGTRILSLSVRHDKNYTPADIMLMCAADMGYETGRTEYGNLYVMINGQRYFYDHWIVNDINSDIDYVIIHLTTEPFSHANIKTRIPNTVFDRDWSKNDIIDLIHKNCYCEFGKHVDMKGLCVNCADIVKTNRDWNELMFIVPKDWLINCVQTLFGVKPHELDDWLNDAYSSDESEQIFAAALEDRQIVMVDFT